MVVAIIGILVTLLMPSLNKARHAAKLAVCLSNQRQIGQAMQIYGSQNNNIVLGDHFGRKHFFANHYSALLGGDDIGNVNDKTTTTEAFKKIGVYQCPSEKVDALWLDYTINGIDLPHYEKSNSYRTTYHHYLDKLPASHSVIAYIVEVNTKKMIDEGINYGAWEVKDEVSTTFNKAGTPNTNPRMISADDDKHLGKTTVNFFDGHAEIRKLSSGGMNFEIFNPLVN